MSPTGWPSGPDRTGARVPRTPTCPGSSRSPPSLDAASSRRSPAPVLRCCRFRRGARIASAIAADPARPSQATPCRSPRSSSSIATSSVQLRSPSSFAPSECSSCSAAASLVTARRRSSGCAQTGRTAALYPIAIVQQRHHPQAKTYLAPQDRRRKDRSRSPPRPQTPPRQRPLSPAHRLGKQHSP